jgi:hypothetical protein
MKESWIESLESFPKVDCVDSDVYCVITPMHPTVYVELEEIGDKTYLVLLCVFQ